MLRAATVLLLLAASLSLTLAIRVHMLGLFHTETTAAYSHCAFTGKVLRFPRMMQPLGYQVIEYGNGQSESGASEFVQVLTRQELLALLPARNSSDFYAGAAVIGNLRTGEVVGLN